MNNLKLDLFPKQDKNGETFYIAKLEGPYTIDCEKGIAIMVFISKEGEEQLQIAPLVKRDKDAAF